MNDADILNPKLMAPRSAELWEWYKTLIPKLIEVIQTRDVGRANDMLEEIILEIGAHAVEIEYQCRI